MLITIAVVVGLGVLIVVAASVASVVEHHYYSDSVLPGVRMNGTQMGGKSDAEIRASIEQLKKQLDNETIRAHAGPESFVADPSLIGFSVDADATIRAIEDAGREGNPMNMVGGTVLRRFRSDDIRLVVHYDEARFEGLLDGWTNALQKGLVEGNLRFQGTTVVAVEPHSGVGLLRDEAERSLRDMLAGTTRTDLDLPIGTVTPQIGREAVNAALTRARTLLTGTFVVVARTSRVSLTPAQIAPTLGTATNRHSLDLTVDPEKLRFVLGPAFGAVEVPPLDATWNISNANAVTVVPSRDGRQLDLAAVGSAILQNARSITATITVEHPVHDTAWANALDITHQVSSFTTHYLSGEPRVHNIHLAADTLNNTVVAPGQTFSLNAKLGQRTPAKGYVEAPIEVEDGFGQDYGGGISQLTTTLFNAVFFGGYVDVDHSPHHYYVSRYPLGREATIVWPYVDLKFRNDSKHGVLIRTSYSNTAITVTFYGNTDGRVATETNRKILHTEPITDRLIPCPVSKPTDDPNNSCPKLLAGEHDTIASGETGYDVEFDRLITQPGKPPVQTHYRVHYPMLPNTVLVGNGVAAPTTVPAVQTTTTTVGQAPVTTRPNPTPTTAHH
jgi:vancomycin resistance protein YoaR